MYAKHLKLKRKQSAIIMGYQTLATGEHGGLFSSTAVQRQTPAPLSDLFVVAAPVE